MKLVRSLVWTVLTYGAEDWTLTKADEKRIEWAELWLYRRMWRVSWTGVLGDRVLWTLPQNTDERTNLPSLGLPNLASLPYIINPFG